LDRIPTTEQLALVVEFENTKSNRNGVPKFIGTDEFNHQIFLLDFGADLKLGLQTISFYLHEHSNPLDWKFFKITTGPDPFRIGGRILHELKMIGMGRKLIALGIQKYYPQISNQVKKTKELGKNLG
jgi:hypothetical protein